MKIKVNKREPQCSWTNYELLQEVLEEYDQKLQNQAQEDEFVEIQEDEIRMAKDEESKFTKMQSEFEVNFTYHHPSAIWLLNTRKTIEEYAGSAYGAAELLDSSQQVKDENATFKNGGNV